eukprot:scaffold4184_cov393-Alexandrium_tamarense.AAC.8
MKTILFTTLLSFVFVDGFVSTNTALTSKPLYLESPKKQGYVPKGFSPEGWSFFKTKETSQHAQKKKHFQSRPLVDYQKDLEAGKVRHLFPVMFAKEKISRGTLKPSEVPYEQRQGRYDNKDVNVGYVPSGLSVHEWHDMQRAEKRKLKEKDFKATGPKGFKSRSFQAFQEDLEKGKVKHLFPTMFARESVAKGLIKEEDVAVSAEDCALLPLPRRSN